MSWRPHGRARLNARAPSAAGICDRCGLLYTHRDLRWQYDWAGARLQNLKILVCQHCLDDPQEQLRAKILSPDPLPIYNARPEPFTVTGFSYQESNILCMPSLSAGDFNSDENDDLSGRLSFPPGLGGDGAQMAQPDGTLLLMPTFGDATGGLGGGGSGIGDFDSGYDESFLKANN